MKKNIVFLLFVIGPIFVGAQTFSAGQNEPGIALQPNDQFPYLGRNIPHYGLGWYNEQPTTPPYLYMSGFSGLKLFTSGVPRLYVDGAGNMGLGTVNPFSKLNILKNDSWSDPGNGSSGVDNLLLLQTGYGPSPASTTSAGYKWGIQFWGRNDVSSLDQTKSGAIYAVSEDEGLGFNRAVGLAFHTSAFDQSSLERLRITADGKVGIGTTSPKEKLSVNGKVRAHEVKVEISNWPDYVFSKTYMISPLNNLEKYIQENHHLPGIPTANTAERDGISLGEMNKKLLEKVEELTLYLIEQHKQQINQEDRIKTLEGELKRLIKP